MTAIRYCNLTMTVLAAVASGCQEPAEARTPVVRPGLGDVAEAACPAGAWPVEDACVPAEAAFTARGGTAYVVAQGHPRASDANPGTAERPWRSISRALAAGVLRPGDAVLIREGVYRETLTPRAGGTETARITIAASPGETVVVTGADVVADWTRQPDGTWRRPWTGPTMETYEDAPTFRRELVVADGAVLRPVFSMGDLAPGRFLVEGPPEAPTAIIARFDDGRLPRIVEVAHRTSLFAPQGPDPYADCGDASTPGFFRVVGLTFRHAANRAQWGAVCFGSEGALVEDVRVEWTNGLGIDVSGRGHTIRRTRSDLNGQLGWGGSCTGCLLEDGAAVGNNWKGHDPFWEAGGAKWTHTSGTVVRRFYAAHNGGPGVWLDIDNDRNTVEGCLAVGNAVAGIMVELRTTRTLVQHNVVAGTRWLGWSGAGILSQAASHNAFVHNTIVANEGTGLWLRLDPDRRAPDGSHVVASNRIVGNATGGEEAREVSVEGTSPAHVRTTRFEGNAYGRLGRDLYRSTFYLHPVDGAEAGFRSDDVSMWRRLTGGDRDARLVGPGDEAPGGSVGPVEAGAPHAAVVPFDRAGADPSRVRAGGDWRGAPPAPAWPR